MKNGNVDTSGVIYIDNENIDRHKWNKCIDTSTNGLIYAYAFYLDAMAKHWDALVMGDYEAVMPVTWNKKYGIYYLYQPFLCASLGLFGRHLTATMLTAFLDHIPPRFKYWDIYLNASNNFILSKYVLNRRINYTLEIRKSYTSLFKNFRTSYKQLIKKKDIHELEIKQNINVKEILIVAQHKLKTISRVKKSDFKSFERLYNDLYNVKRATSYGVYLKGELLASGIFLFSNGRAYYVLAGNKTAGKRYGASQLIIDSFIKEYAGHDILLDFEGSNVPGIAFFFKGFGAEPEEYPGLKYNALPAVLRRFKK